MNVEAIEKGHRRGRIYAKRERWVEPFEARKTKGTSIEKEHAMTNANSGTSRDVVHENRFQWGFHKDNVEVPFRLEKESTKLYDGAGLFLGGLTRLNVLETLAQPKPVVIPPETNSTTILLDDDATNKIGISDFGGSF